MTITLKDFTEDLSAYQKLSSYVLPPPACTIYAMLVYNNTTNSFTYAVKDTQIFYSFVLKGTVEGESKSFGVKVDPSNIFYIFEQYPMEQVKTLKMSFTKNEDMPLNLFIQSSTDDIQIPCQNIDEDDLADIIYLIDSNSPPEDTCVTFSNDNVDIPRGINEALPFMGTDDKVHNALALYSDRVSYNDRRHIFVFDVDSAYQVDGLDVDVPIPLHKKASKIVDYLYTKGLPFQVFLDKKGLFVWIKYSYGVMKINNSLSNIAPPSHAMFESLCPTNKVSDIGINPLQDTVSFFTGFYVKGDAWKPIALTIREKDILFELRSSSSSTASCAVERVFPVDIDEKCELDKVKNTFILSNDSILTYLRGYKGKQPTKVSIHATDSSMGTLFSYDNKKILIAKLDNSKTK